MTSLHLLRQVKNNIFDFAARQSPDEFTLPACESVVSAKVNPHARGLLRLEESVALSQHRVRDHTPIFKESRPFYFLTLYPAADANWVQCFTVSPSEARGEIDSSRFQ